MNILADFVKNRRKQLNLTQEEFAKKSRGSSYSHTLK